MQEEFVHPVDVPDEHRQNDEEDRLHTQKGGVAVPAGLLVEGGNVVRFGFGRATAPADVSTSQDQRTLAVGFDYVGLTKSPPDGVVSTSAETAKTTADTRPVDTAVLHTLPISEDFFLQFGRKLRQQENGFRPF